MRGRGALGKLRLRESAVQILRMAGLERCGEAKVKRRRRSASDTIDYGKGASNTRCDQSAEDPAAKRNERACTVLSGSRRQKAARRVCMHDSGKPGLVRKIPSSTR